MSNTKNLANLAAALDDGTSGQVLQSTGSGGVQFADSSGSGVTTHTNQAAMISADTSSAYTEGSLHFDLNANVLYVKIGSGAGDGFYAVATVENAAPTINSFSENTGGAGANDLTADGTFTLTAGSNTVITINATEPNLETISYSATVTSGTATDVFSSPSFPVTNQSSNVFTLTPVTSGSGGTVTIRFDASDGTNVANVSHSFEIAFLIADSHFTSLLMATDGSAGNNQDDISDSSSNNHPITVNGDAHAGTFSPYRHGGYSIYFDGSGDYLQLSATATDLLPETSNTTIEAWVNTTGTGHVAIFSNFNPSSPYNGIEVGLYNGYQTIYSQGSWINNTGGTGVSTINDGSWHHLAWVITNSGATVTTYVDGVQNYTSSITASTTGSSNQRIGASANSTVNRHFTGYISDVRFVKGTAVYTSAFTPPTERLTAVTNTKLLTCHLPYIADGSSSAHSITTSGDPETKPFGPYDYNQYLKSDNGGSVYFDGSGDYLSAADSDDWHIGASSFTIEFWIYKANKGNYSRVISNRATGTDEWGVFLDITSNTTGYEEGAVRLDWGADYYWWNSSTADIPVDQWTHIAITRSGTSAILYVNGVSKGSVTLSGDISNISGPLTIGTSDGTGDYYKGYLSDLRLVNGTVVYSGNFTPPTGPLTTTGGTYPSTTNVDTSITASNTKLLLKGTDAHVLDKSQGSNLKLAGTAASTSALTSGSTPPYIGAAWANTSAVSFDGDSDYVFVPASPLLDISSSDVTIEGYFYTTSTSVKQGVWQLYSDDNNYARLFFEGGNGNVLRLTLYSSSTERLNVTGTTTLSINTWYHIAVTRDHSTGAWKTFINGVQDTGASGTESAAVNTSAWDFEIGRDLVGTNDYWSGYMQDFRFTQGKNRYPNNNFTVPSAPLKG